MEMAPWQYIFDGKEDEYGAYLWILKPEMAAAFRELEESEVSAENSVREALAADISSFGTEGNLFSSTADETVEKIRNVLEEREPFFPQITFRKSGMLCLRDSPPVSFESGALRRRRYET